MSRQSEWLLSKSLQTITAGEGENLMESETNLWRKVSEEQKDLAKNSDQQYH